MGWRSGAWTHGGSRACLCCLVARALYSNSGTGVPLVGRRARGNARVGPRRGHGYGSAGRAAACRGRHGRGVGEYYRAGDLEGGVGLQDISRSELW